MVDKENGSGISGAAARLVADLSNATAATIREIRRAEAAQRFLEKENLFGGARYIESMFAHFGVISPDARLQRPEYLGGGIIPVQVQEVTSTSESSSHPLAEPGGRGTGYGSTASFKYKVREFGYIIGILSIVPRAAYQQGLPRHFSRLDRMSYPWPEFSRIGDQEVLNQEIFLRNAPAAANAGTFGYQERYAELKASLDEVHGDMRNSLDFWHATRIFSVPPGLNQQFVEVQSFDLDRNWAVPGSKEQHFWINIYHEVKALRPYPQYGTPAI